jgi:dihydropteroate synthase
MVTVLDDARPVTRLPVLPRVMGVLNVTPDSFSDGGRWLGREPALRHVASMVAEGADIIDIGGESTRPGAAEVPEQQELDRVVPVLEALRGEFDVTLSIDTSKPGVMREAVAAGAGMINDVFALRRKGALQVAAELAVPVCLMHMQGAPRSMQKDPRYDDVVGEVEAFLLERAASAQAAGIDRGHIVLDPGFGFGKTLDHNLALLRHLPRLCSHGYPVLAGLSRKSMLQALTGRTVEQRLAGSLALGLAAARGGAAIIRVHDVAETVDVLRVMAAAWPEGALAG